MSASGRWRSTGSARRCWPDTGRACPGTTTCRRRGSGRMSRALKGELILSAEDSLVRMSALRDSGLGWLEPELDCSSMLLLSHSTSKRGTSCWRMSRDFYQATQDAISESSSLVWPTEGIATSNGVFLTRSSSESPSVVVDSSLSRVLETDPDPKYCIGPKAAAGILERSERKGRELAEPLLSALRKSAAAES